LNDVPCRQNDAGYRCREDTVRPVSGRARRGTFAAEEGASRQRYHAHTYSFCHIIIRWRRDIEIASCLPVETETDFCFLFRFKGERSRCAVPCVREARNKRRDRASHSAGKQGTRQSNHPKRERTEVTLSDPRLGTTLIYTTPLTHVRRPGYAPSGRRAPLTFLSRSHSLSRARAEATERARPAHKHEMVRPPGVLTSHHTPTHTPSNAEPVPRESSDGGACPRPAPPFWQPLWTENDDDLAMGRDPDDAPSEGDAYPRHASKTMTAMRRSRRGRASPSVLPTVPRHHHHHHHHHHHQE
jgi:hypothetical protein